MSVTPIETTTSSSVKKVLIARKESLEDRKFDLECALEAAGKGVEEAEENFDSACEAEAQSRSANQYAKNTLKHDYETNMRQELKPLLRMIEYLKEKINDIKEDYAWRMKLRFDDVDNSFESDLKQAAKTIAETKKTLVYRKGKEEETMKALSKVCKEIN